MDGLLDLAWKIFLFIMLITSWRELIKLGVVFIEKIATGLTRILQNIGR